MSIDQIRKKIWDHKKCFTYGFSTGTQHFVSVITQLMVVHAWISSELLIRDKITLDLYKGYVADNFNGICYQIDRDQYKGYVAGNFNDICYQIDRDPLFLN